MYISADHIHPVIITISVLVAVIAFAVILVVYLRERYTFVQTPNEETADYYFYFNPKDGNALQEFKGPPGRNRDGIYMNSDSGHPSGPPPPSAPRRVKDGLSVMYNTAKNWVTGMSSSFTSQNSVYSYDNL